MTDESEALQAIIDAGEHGVYALDRDLRYVAFNLAHAQAMRELYAAEIVVGGRLTDYLTLDADRRSALVSIRRALAGERVTDTASAGGEGRRRTYESTYTPRAAAAGTVTGVVVQTRETTDSGSREEAPRRSRAYLEAILDSTADGILAVDDSGKVMVANRRFAELWRIPTVLVESGDDDALLAFVLDQLSDPEAFLSKVRSLYGSDATDADTLTFKDGRIFERHSAATLEGSTVTGRVWSFSDVTERSLAEAAVRASEAEFRTLVENINDVVARHDLDLRFTYVSPAIEGFLGMRPAEMVGKTNLEAGFPHTLAAAFDEALRRALATERPVELEFSIAGREGDLFSLTRVFPELDSRGRPASVVTVSRDITERKRAEAELAASERRFRSLFEDSPVATWEEDHSSIKAHLEELVAAGVEDIESYLCEHPDEYERCTKLGHTLDVNQAAVVLFEAATRTELIERQTEIYPVRTMCGLPGVWAAWLDGRRSGSHEEVNLTLGGHTLQVLETVSVASGHEDDWSRVYLADINVTERRQAEEEVRRLNAELEERVVSRTAQLDAANKELEAFAYSISHDLRAPLRAIDGFSAMVVEDASDKLGGDDLEHLQRVRAGAQRMAALIDELLGLSRASRRELLREEVDVSALAVEVLAELREAHPDRRVETVVAPGLHASADPVLLRSVLANLLSNAWKFTSRHETARIEVGARDAGGDHVFFVRDDGAGFDARHAKHLFGAFQRMHAAGQFEGDGIGLATVQRLVTRHGGRVWAEAEVEKGATFFFTLPARTSTA